MKKAILLVMIIVTALIIVVNPREDKNYSDEDIVCMYLDNKGIEYDEVLLFSEHYEDYIKYLAYEDGECVSGGALNKEVFYNKYN